MPERKTVGQLMEEMRLKAGAQNYHGHEYMDLQRFAEDTRHMIMSKLRERNQKYRQKVREAREADPEYLRQLGEKERIRQEKLLEAERKCIMFSCTCHSLFCANFFPEFSRKIPTVIFAKWICGSSKPIC